MILEKYLNFGYGQGDFALKTANLKDFSSLYY